MTGDRLAAVRAHGKYLYADGQKFLVRGVTYGTFRPTDDGVDYPPPHAVGADFAAMAATGVNVVRTYTVPPRWLLDIAAENGLRVLVGLPWEHHVAFLDDAARCRDIERRVRAGARACAGHSALLGLSVGNEIPAPIVRWHGPRPIERFLDRLCAAVRDEAPGALVTYVNYPSTEYLDVPSVDLLCYNVFLEQPEKLAAYLPRLQSLAGDRPLLLTEVGLDSRSNGLDTQADALGWQLRTAFSAGVAGTCVFSWTDEWHRGGHDIEDWDFGLVDRAREPKPALHVVHDVYTEMPASGTPCPRISVVVCTHNGSRTLRECLTGLAALDYPDFETIVVDDGSTDEVPAIISEFDVRRVTTPGVGLSAARNLGLEAATGEIVAYLDDDAWPDPHWLRYLAVAFADGRFGGVGGPNLSPPGDCTVAECVANAPGGPAHVLLTDELAEHIPGCNMSFRREALLEIGGFDAQFRTAGDDVDICWRLQDAGHQIGFHAGALVWHRRRPSVRAFWRQQRGYGHAEALLERKWPERYNAAGHVNWTGRIYGPGGVGLFRRWRVYYGTWGTAAFQSRYEAPTPPLTAYPLMPEWYLVLALLAGVFALGALWTPLLLAGPLLVAATAVVVAQAIHGARRARFSDPWLGRSARMRRRGLIAMLYILQGAARLRGRIAHGLAPWGRRARVALRPPHTRRRVVWTEDWQAPEEHLAAVESAVLHGGARASRGGHFDRWDLHVRGGGLGAARLRLAVEEHGSERQLLRFSVTPIVTTSAVIAAAATAALAAAAASDGASAAAAVLGAACAALALATIGEAVAAWSLALKATSGLADSTVLGVDGAQRTGRRWALRRPQRGASTARPERSAERLSPGPAVPAMRLARGHHKPAIARVSPAVGGAGGDGVRRRRLRTWPLQRRPAAAVSAPKRATDHGSDPLAATGRERPGLLRRLQLFRYMKGHIGDALIVIASLAASTALTLAQPWPTKLLLDNVIGHHPVGGFVRDAARALPGDPTHALLVLLVVATVAIFLFGALMEMLSTLAVTRLGQRVTYDLAGDVFAHLQKLSLGFHARRPVGDTIARVGHDTFGLQGLLTGAVIPVIHSFATLGAMFAIMWQLSPHLTVLALLVIPVQFLAILAFAKPMKKRSRERLDNEGRLVTVVQQTLTSIPVIQAFTREDVENERFVRHADSTVRAYVRETVTSMWFKLFAGIATAGGSAGIMYLGADAALKGQLTAGTIVVFIAYLAGLYAPLNQIAYTATAFQTASAQTDRVIEVLDTPLDVHDGPGSRDLEIRHGHVRIENVVFGYANGRPVLNGVSIEALPGEVVAIVGPTGAGKTTLVNLLMRFFDPESGRVVIDGHDVRDYTLRSLRGQIAMVLQDPFILPISVAELIAYGRPDASQAEIEAAAQAANAHDFIMRLPEGYNSVIGERGATLSGGEKQRLSIARAFLKAAPILVLDEPTSALDARTEAALLDAMRRLADGRTSFIIAHRLSTIRDADRIVVVEHGRVVEQGRHEELVGADGLYRHLYDQQTRGDGNGRRSRRFVHPASIAEPLIELDHTD